MSKPNRFKGGTPIPTTPVMRETMPGEVIIRKNGDDGVWCGGDCFYDAHRDEPSTPFKIVRFLMPPNAVQMMAMARLTCDECGVNIWDSIMEACTPESRT